MRNYNLISIFLGIIAMFVLGVTLMQLRVVLMPFALAILLSVVFKPVVIGLKARRIPTALSLLGVLIAFFLVLFLVGWFLFASADTFAAELPRYESRVTEYLVELEAFAASWLARYDVDVADFSWSNTVSISSMTAVLTTGVGTFITFLGTTFLVLLFMMFLLAGSGDLANKVSVAFPAVHADRIAVVVSNVDSQVRRYLITKTLMSLATGLMTSLILVIFGVDFPVVWGFLAFVLNYIPNFGSLIAVAFPVVLSLLQFDSAGLTLVIMLLLVTSQATLGNVVEPRVMGFSLNLSPLFILVSLIFWGWLWGLWGMVLAVPMTATIKIIFENIDVLQPFSVLMSGWNPADSPRPSLAASSEHAETEKGVGRSPRPAA